MQRNCENIESSMTMMTVDLRSFQDKVENSFDQKGVFKGLYEFRHTDIEFFED